MASRLFGSFRGFEKLPSQLVLGLILRLSVPPAMGWRGSQEGSGLWETQQHLWCLKPSGTEHKILQSAVSWGHLWTWTPQYFKDHFMDTEAPGISASTLPSAWHSPCPASGAKGGSSQKMGYTVGSTALRVLISALSTHCWLRRQGYGSLFVSCLHFPLNSVILVQQTCFCFQFNFISVEQTNVKIPHFGFIV